MAPSHPSFEPLDGSPKALLLGPNCRTRSVPRHFPLPIPGGGPRPLRSWHEPWGKATNTEEEKAKVWEDHVLLWRGLMIFVAQEEVRKAVGGGEEGKIKLMLEQPANQLTTFPSPELVSFWGTKDWQSLKRLYNLQEQTFKQSDFGGKAVKPTTIGGNLKLKNLQSPEEFREEEIKAINSSKDLARWAPGLMREIAERLQEVVMRRRVRFAQMSWHEHLQRGHTP